MTFWVVIWWAWDVDAIYRCTETKATIVSLCCNGDIYVYKVRRFNNNKNLIYIDKLKKAIGGGKYKFYFNILLSYRCPCKLAKMYFHVWVYKYNFLLFYVCFELKV